MRQRIIAPASNMTPNAGEGSPKIISSNGNPTFDNGHVSVIAPPKSVRIKPETANPIASLLNLLVFLCLQASRNELIVGDLLLLQ